MGIEVRIEDDNREEIIQKTREAIETALDAVGMQAATIAKTELQNSPERIDTGLLRNSITWAVAGKPAGITTYSPDKPSKYDDKMPPGGHYGGSAPEDPEGQKSVYVGTNVEYATYVHEGTQRMSPNRFLKKALEGNRGEYEQIFAKVLRDLS